MGCCQCRNQHSANKGECTTPGQPYHISNSSPGVCCVFMSTHANPKAIIPHVPTLTRVGIRIRQRNKIGKVERMKSVAAAIATGLI